MESFRSLFYSYHKKLELFGELVIESDLSTSLFAKLYCVLMVDTKSSHHEIGEEAKNWAKTKNQFVTN